MSNERIETSHGSIALIDTGGRGVPIVMIHANSVCKESFKPQIEALAGLRRVIAFDLPGHGASGDAIDPRRTYSIPGYADALLEALGSLSVTRFVALGHSLGGHVVLEMLAKNAPVDGALIFGTPPISNDLEGLQAGFKPSPEMAYTGSAFLTEQQIGMVVELALGKEASDNKFFLEAVRRTDGLARQYMIEAAIGGKGSNQRHLVETSPIPLAIINGENDAVIDLDYVDSIVYANVWEGKPIRLCGAGHALHWEQTQKFNETLLRFEDFLNG
jgi:pimeloyl-ACP methyl ester carboxylesterase